MNATFENLSCGVHGFQLFAGMTGTGHPLTLIVFVDLGIFGVDDLLLAGAGGLARRGLGARRGCGLLVLLVDRLAELHRHLGERFRLGLDRVGVAALDRTLGLSDRRLDLGLERFVDLVAMLLELLLGRMDQALGLV